MSGIGDKPLTNEDGEARELTTRDFERAVRVSGQGGLDAAEAELRRRRATPHELVALDADVVERFKAGGPNWPTRINAALRKAAGM